MQKLIRAILFLTVCQKPTTNDQEMQTYRQRLCAMEAETQFSTPSIESLRRDEESAKSLSEGADEQERDTSKCK